MHCIINCFFKRKSSGFCGQVFLFPRLVVDEPIAYLSKSCLLSVLRALCLPIRGHVCLFPRWFEDESSACHFELMYACFLDGSRMSPLHVFSESCLLVSLMVEDGCLCMPLQDHVCLLPRLFKDEPFACHFEVMSASFHDGSRTSPLHAFSKSCLPRFHDG